MLLPAWAKVYDNETKQREYSELLTQFPYSWVGGADRGQC